VRQVAALLHDRLLRIQAAKSEVYDCSTSKMLVGRVRLEA
jgi:hypothetical protein